MTRGALYSIIDDLRGLNWSNRMDGEHRWGQLMILLEDSIDPDVDQKKLARRLAAEGFDDRAALISAIESVLEARAAALRTLLTQVRRLK